MSVEGFKPNLLMEEQQVAACAQKLTSELQLWFRLHFVTFKFLMNLGLV